MRSYHVFIQNAIIFLLGEQIKGTMYKFEKYVMIQNLQQHSIVFLNYTKVKTVTSNVLEIQ